MARYMIHCNGAAVYVKEGCFFDEQKAEFMKTHPQSDWYKHWTPVYADSIEHARLMGQNHFTSTGVLKKARVWNSEAPGA